MTLFQLNSEAVWDLHHNDSTSSISKLHRVMDELRQMEQENRGFRLDPAMRGYGSQEEEEPSMEIMLIANPVGGGEGDDTALFAPYEMAFSTALMNYEGERGLMLTRSFVLYNLGLAHHLQNNNPQRALRYYQWSLQFIQANAGDGLQEDVTLLVLSLLNNMGHLLSSDLDRAREIITWISSILHQNPWCQDLMMYPQFQFFHSAVIIFHQSAYANAPAA